MARVAAILFLAGGAFMAASRVLPHPTTLDHDAIGAIAAAYLVGALFLVLAAERITPRGLHAVVAASSALICAAIYFAGIASGVYSTMFLWVVLITAYFCSPRAAYLHLAWLLAVYGATLGLLGGGDGFSPLTRWTLTAIALAVGSATVVELGKRRRAAEDRVESFFDLSRDLLAVSNRDGYFVDVNPAWQRTLGYSPAEICSSPWIAFVHPGDVERTIAEAAGLWDGQETVEFENRYRAKDGGWRWLRWSSKLGSAGDLIYGRATDVTEHKRLMAEVESQAKTDSLTGLPNRRWMHDELSREITRAESHGFELCVAVLDLDHFKAFNDAYGHAEGDALLCEVAERWRGALRHSDFLTRWGGEEFVLLLPDCPLLVAQDVISRLRPLVPRKQTFSAGVVRWRPGEDVGAVIRRADDALYAAKAAGRDRIVIRPDATASATAG